MTLPHMALPKPAPRTPAKPRQVAEALARAAYVHDRLRIANADLTGFAALVASRQGLFAIAEGGRVSQVAWGLFFGIRRHQDRIYLFEAGDRPASHSQRGRIVSLALCDGTLSDPQVLVRGIDNNCHQIAIIDEAICVVDTANQRVLRFTLEGAPLEHQQVLPRADRTSGSAAYRHINAIAQIGGRIALLLHNGGDLRDRPSELAWLNDDWTIAERQVLPGHGCHDIVADAAGRVWHCGSRDGELIGSNGLRVKVSPLLTRGLALGPHGFVVGYSQFGARPDRQALPGGVLFLDADFSIRSDVPLAGAPTDLILL